jgi:soluble lytic murein transglycosylase-like protein
MHQHRTQSAALLLALCLLLSSLVVKAANTEVDPRLKQLLEQAITTPNGFVDRYDAEVWLNDMSHRLSHFVEDPQERIEILRVLHYEARRANLEPELVLAVVEVESGFDRFAISNSGARGLMQIMPFWLNEINLSDTNLFKIRTNLRMGCTILRYYLDMESNDIGPALARYNGSYGHTKYANRVIRALHKHWFKQ